MPPPEPQAAAKRAIEMEIEQISKTLLFISFSFFMERIVPIPAGANGALGNIAAIA